MRDEFLSEEDLALRDLSPDELDRLWTAWLVQASATDAQDAGIYAHGVFAGHDLTAILAAAGRRPGPR